jgi:hypothetical protein
VEDVLSSWLNGRGSLPEEKDVLLMKDMIQIKESPDLPLKESQDEIKQILTLCDPN